MNKNTVDVYSTTTITKDEAAELINSKDVKAISMYNGKFLLVIDTPSKFEILNPEDASKTPFAIATSIRGFGEQTHYIYFVDPDDANLPAIYEGYFNIKDSVKEKLLALIDQMRPEIEIYEIDASHIPFVKDDNGAIINAKESLNSSLIGMFQLHPAVGNFHANSGVRLMRVVD